MESVELEDNCPGSDVRSASDCRPPLLDMRLMELPVLCILVGSMEEVSEVHIVEEDRVDRVGRVDS